MEALEELSVLLPALEVYASDTHVSEVIANAKKQIALAEANIPQAKVKFESAPLKDQVSRSYAKLNVRPSFLNSLSLSLARSRSS
jgi:hypothetical protein